MTVLKKHLAVNITPGVPGTPGVHGTPAKAGYWSYRTVRTAVTSTATAQPVDTVNESPVTISPISGNNLLIIGEKQNIDRCTWDQLRNYMPTLRPLMDKIQDNYDNGLDKAAEGTASQIEFQNDWDAYKIEANRILQAEINSGKLGNPLALLPISYGENAYIAAWDTGSVWFYVFTGFTTDDMPYQRRV